MTGFAMVPNWLVRHPEVDPYMLAVFTAVSSHVGDGKGRLSYATLAAELGCSEATVKRAARRLRAACLLEWSTETTPKGSINTYWLAVPRQGGEVPQTLGGEVTETRPPSPVTVGGSTLHPGVRSQGPEGSGLTDPRGGVSQTSIEEPVEEEPVEEEDSSPSGESPDGDSPPVDSSRGGKFNTPAHPREGEPTSTTPLVGKGTGHPDRPSPTQTPASRSTGTRGDPREGPARPGDLDDVPSCEAIMSDLARAWLYRIETTGLMVESNGSRKVPSPTTGHPLSFKGARDLAWHLDRDDDLARWAMDEFGRDLYGRAS